MLTMPAEDPEPSALAGLSQAEALRRFTHDGPNELPRREGAAPPLVG